MGHLISTGPCPFCNMGQNTPCFATYSDGYKCFTCGRIKFGNTNDFIPRNSLISTSIKVPEHTQNIGEFSPAVLHWLYKYYVYDDLIKEYGISYVKYNKYGVFEGESLLFPVFGEGKTLIFYQQRFFPNKQFITKGDKNNIFYINKHDSNDLYLVEDYLSAIRLGEYTNVICLFGVHVNYVMSKFIQNLNMNIKIWLDPDEAGQKASKELLGKLGNLMCFNAKRRAFAVREQLTVEVLQTEIQPKDFCNQELKQIITREVK